MKRPPLACQVFMQAKNKKSTGILHCNRLESIQDNNIEKIVQGIPVTSEWLKISDFPIINIHKKSVSVPVNFLE